MRRQATVEDTKPSSAAARPGTHLHTALQQQAAAARSVGQQDGHQCARHVAATNDAGVEQRGLQTRVRAGGATVSMAVRKLGVCRWRRAEGEWQHSLLLFE